MVQPDLRYVNRYRSPRKDFSNSVKLLIKRGTSRGNNKTAYSPIAVASLINVITTVASIQHREEALVRLMTRTSLIATRTPTLDPSN